MMEEHLLTTEIEVPVYFAQENEKLAELVETLDRDTSGAAGKKVSAAESECKIGRLDKFLNWFYMSL